MNKTAVKKWKRGMELMNDRVRQETRQMSIAEKLAATAQLMRLALARPETPAERKALNQARKNWRRLREASFDRH